MTYRREGRQGKAQGGQAGTEQECNGECAVDMEHTSKKEETPRSLIVEAVDQISSTFPTYNGRLTTKI